MRVIGESFGVQPRIRHGVRGEGLVMMSVAGPQVSLDSDAYSGGTRGSQSGTQRRWEALIPLLIGVPGQPQYELAVNRWMSRAKYPVAGVTIPVTVDRDDPDRVRIEWAEVPSIDELIDVGHPVFTTPDRVVAELAQALFQGAAPEPASMLGGRGWDRGLTPAATQRRVAQQMLDLARQIVAAGARRALAEPRSGAPSATVLAIASSMRSRYHGEILLSVAVPGRPRFGARWSGSIDMGKVLDEWGEVPVRINSQVPGKVDVLWEQVPTRIQAATGVAARYGAELEARLAASPAIVKLATGPTPSQATPDQLDRLARLARLRGAGALTEAEFAAEKRRTLDQT